MPECNQGLNGLEIFNSEASVFCMNTLEVKVLLRNRLGFMNF
jgi:hypothetical protein